MCELNNIYGPNTPLPMKEHFTFFENSGCVIKCPVKNPPCEYPIIPNLSRSKI